MIGIYYLPIPVIAHETGCSIEGSSKALRSLESVGFAFYDHENEVVWVPEMAAHQIDDDLSPKDKRVKGVERELDPYRKSKFFNEFMARYGVRFHLQQASPDGGEKGATKPLVSPFVAPTKPRTRTRAGTRTRTEDQVHPHPADADPPKAGQDPPPPPADKCKTRIPEGFAISDRVRAWADGKGHDRLDEHLASFIAKCKAHGYRYVDWDSALMEAIRADWAKLRPAAKVMTLAEQRARRMAEHTGQGDEQHGRIIDITPTDDGGGAFPALPSDLREPGALDVG
jgi:hypothetical protein